MSFASSPQTATLNEATYTSRELSFSSEDSATGPRKAYTTTKEAWIHQSLKKRDSEFLEHHKINAFVGTWNVNGRTAADPNELRAWLDFVPKSNDSVVFADLPELVVLGFQELDVRAEAFVYNNAVKDSEWTQAIESSMGDARYSYQKLTSKQLIGMFIMVYVRLDVIEYVSDVQTMAIGCGIMGVVGNKGGVAVHLAYKDTPICFVCSHLAHGAEQLEKRNMQFYDLCKRITFNNNDGVPLADPLMPDPNNTQRKHSVGVFDHAYVIWFGDLNYRLVIDTEEIREYIQNKNYDVLMGLDQLRITILNRQAFPDFEEPNIDFPPSYKYLIGTDEFDRKRQPAWCDRILWWTQPEFEDGVRGSNYECVQSLMTSDHKPVRMRLSIGVWDIDREKRQDVFLDVLRELDRYENECIPIATLSSSTIDFGEVYFGKEEAEHVELINTGQVPLEYNFIPTPGRNTPTPCWLKITPSAGMLLPGEQTKLRFTALVDRRISAPFSVRELELSDILILHLDRGRDYFVQVQGDYQTSVLGTSLDVLVHCKKPVRDMDQEDFLECLGSGRYSVPSCVWTLTDFLSQHGIKAGYSLFSYPGSADLACKIIEHLDLGRPLDPEEIIQGSSSCRGEGPAESSSTKVGEETLSRNQNITNTTIGSVSTAENTFISSTIHSALTNMSVSERSPEILQDLDQLMANPWESVSVNDIGTSQSQHEQEANRSSNVDSYDEDRNKSCARSVSSSSSESGDASSSLPTHHSTTTGDLAGSPLPEVIVSTALPHDLGVDTVADCLIAFFNSLPEPLIPSRLYDVCVEAGSVSRAAALEALEEMPPGNLNVLVYLLAFLREAVEMGATSTHVIAKAFSKALLRPSDGSIENNDEGAVKFLALLLRSHGQL